MASTQFFLTGEGSPSTAIAIDVSDAGDMDGLKLLIAGQFAITAPDGIAFQASGKQLDSIADIQNASEAVGITIDGHPVREIPGPTGAPWVGSYMNIFPDHLGNNERMFKKYGPIFQTTSLGRKSIQCNDPRMALIALTESDFFTKQVTNENHPLYPIRQPTAGVFLADTDNPSWKIVHKFLPPCLGPKAVRHYAPLMNQTVNGALPVFDELEQRDEAFNVYQYMLKLGSQAIGKLVLDMDWQHFTNADAPLSPYVIAMADLLSLNKKISSKVSDWYASLPFGDPKRLKEIQAWQEEEVSKAIARASSSGKQDLPLEDAALDAANVIDYLTRAVDSQGNKLPKENLIHATMVASGAGFTTTSTLLSWLIYGLVTYPGMQARLLQELIDNDITDETEITPDISEKLVFQEHYVKEMQRLHNPSYQPGRVARIDCILPGGYRVHEGDVVISALHHIHTNPQWWENAARFDPDRWNDNPVKHKAQYIPFATGQRMCIGFNFALQEVKVFLPKFVYRYHWEKEGETAVEYDPFFQLIRPVNLYVKTTKRTRFPSKSDSHQASVPS